MRIKSISRVILLILFVLLIGVQAVHAQQAVIVWFDPMAAQVNAGETTTVKLIVDAQTPINSFDLTFEYDPNVVMLESWKYGDFLPKLSALKNEATPGRLWLVSLQLGVPPVTGAGVLLEFTLRGVAPGTSALTFSQVKFAGGSGEYEAGVTEGSISVAAGLPPTATLTLSPTATYTLVPTLASTATRTLVPTLAPTATRTSIPVPQPTRTPQPQPTLTHPTKAVSTLQSAATGQTAQEPTLLTKVPADKLDAAATLDAMSTASAAGGTNTPGRAILATATAPAADKENPGINLTTIIIVFDLIVLAFIGFLLWKRGRKNLEGKS